MNGHNWRIGCSQLIQNLSLSRIRFRGQPGEQGTFFILDPSGNALEFKGFRDFSLLFAG
jgi:extradiol dioxygenase family protein